MADQAAINAMNAAIAAIQALQAAVTGLPAAIQAAVQQPLPGIGPLVLHFAPTSLLYSTITTRNIEGLTIHMTELLFRPHLVEPVEYRDA